MVPSDDLLYANNYVKQEPNQHSGDVPSLFLRNSTI